METVTCQGCGQRVPKKQCCGVGPIDRAVWTCTDCILAGAMDRVFAPIGETIWNAVRAAQSAPPDAGEGSA